MTPSTKPVTRLTPATVRDRGQRRQVVVTVVQGLIELRLKGCRQRETVDIETLWHDAIKTRVWATKEAKRKARELKKKGRAK